MSYQVLARKWRPSNFEELVGQQQTSQALINALESQRLHHAYLFTGTRGVGKTTIARILSKSLNCEIGITSTPCNQCSSCLEITQGNFVDLLEIDAASKTKVEDTRELLENVQYRPTRGRYKVYLIDEVHMLSGHSFNALLKTLEEPPPHVIFLLATTDPQKMPVTVLSRCLQFHLRRMEQTEIINHLIKILQAENITFEEEALEPIAKGADGSMRDALSLLDQAIAYCGDKIVKTAVLEMLGSIDRAYAYQLLDAICQDDASLLMQAIDRIAEYAPDYDELLADWLSLLHNIAIEQAVNNDASQVSDSKIAQLASEIKPADLQLFYQLSLQARRDLAFAPHPRQGFEMAMLRILAFKPQSINTNSTPPLKKKAEIINQKSNNQHANSASSSITPNHSTEQNVAQENSFSQTTPMTLATNNRSINSTGQMIAQDNQTHEMLAESLPAPAFKIETRLEPKLKVVINNDLQNNEQQNNGLKDTTNQSHLQNSESDNQQNSNEIILSQKSHTTVENNNKKSLKLASLNEITSENWFNVVESLDVTGHALQVLLNSIGEVQQNNLQINYLTKVEPLLTQSAQANVIESLQSCFKQEVFKINFVAVETSSETPRERQSRLYEKAIDQAQQKLLANPQMSYLIDQLAATMPRESIKLLK